MQLLPVCFWQGHGTMHTHQLSALVVKSFMFRFCWEQASNTRILSGQDGDAYVFGEKGRPESYSTPFHTVVPETIFFCGSRKDLHCHGYRPADSYAKRANWNNLLVDENRLIQPRARNGVGKVNERIGLTSKFDGSLVSPPFTGLYGFVFEGLRRYVWYA